VWGYTGHPAEKEARVGVQQFRRKPTKADREDQVAARYIPGEPLTDLLSVARMAHLSAELAEVEFKSGTVLLVRYLDVPDDHPAEWKFEVVQAGDWLAYSPGNDMLYDSDEAEWAQFYDEVPR
jgi:hypothetical protein